MIIQEGITKFSFRLYEIFLSIMFYLASLYNQEAKHYLRYSIVDDTMHDTLER